MRPILRSPFFAGALIIGAVVCVYANTLRAPFLLDDAVSVVANASIRAPLTWAVLSPPADCTVAGRPVANLSFALNHAMGGQSPFGYHLGNILLHAATALLLAGVIRRTLAANPSVSGEDRATLEGELRDGLAITGERSSAMQRRVDGSQEVGRDMEGAMGPGSQPVDAVKAPRWGCAEDPAIFATLAALAWALHPILTASVSYVSQRTELLMAFFALATLYAFVRFARSGRGRWAAASVAACWLGMGSKEGMVVVPVIVAVYDVVFVAGSLRTAWARRRGYYLALAASWSVLGLLMVGLRERAVGFGLGVSSWQYALTETEAVLRYLKLALWPHPLIFDYGALFADASPRTMLFVVGAVTFVGATLLLIVRRPRLGFLPFTFLLLLAPTSSVVPVAAQPIAENRVYLAAAAVAVGLMLLIARLASRRAAWFGVALIAAFAATTIARNRVLADPIRLWRETAQLRPMNPRASANLGETYFMAGRMSEAREWLERAVALKPDYPEPRNNLGVALFNLGEHDAALKSFAEAVRLKPDFVSARQNWGRALLKLGRAKEAVVQFAEAWRVALARPQVSSDLGTIASGLGEAQLQAGDSAAAVLTLEEAKRLRPNDPDVEMNLGVALRITGAKAESRRRLEAAINLRPNFPEAHFNLAIVCSELGDLVGVRQHLEEATRLRPAFGLAHRALGNLALQQNRPAEAHRHFTAALPDFPDDTDLRAKWEATRSALDFKSP